MINKNNCPLVSVVVPVYGTSKYLNRCLDSILQQSYSNIEVLTVNDASPDNSKDIILRYQQNDPRVKLVDNPSNLGLFRARMEGAKIAQGKYITFIDSDDYIGIDYIRSLVFKAEQEQADIVKAQFIMDDERIGEKYVYNYINYRPRITLTGKAIADEYFRQEGVDFSWHILCVKLYSMKLWKKCEHFYKNINTHLIMTEDIAFSTPLFLLAEKYTEVDCDTYFYVQRKAASTGIAKDIKKFEKNISDLKVSFDFRTQVLKELNVYEQYEKNHIAWKENYGRSWKNAIKWAGFDSADIKYLEDLVRHALGIEQLEMQTKEDGYYYSVTTKWSDREEVVKKQIINHKIHCVSFDIFDTLICRPFFEPSDLFRILEYRYKQLNPKTHVDFSKIRIEAEREARNAINDIGREEITLKEIYERISNEYNISTAHTKNLMEYEKELEIKFCYRRNFGYELYNIARFLNKKIVLTSDMYLDKDTIIAILSSNGYNDYEKLYLSSESQKTKSTGNLYHDVTKECDKKTLIHVGDNYQSDYLKPKELGIESIYLPKAIDVFTGKLVDSGYNVGNSFYNMLRPCGNFFDHKVSMEFWGIRCMLSVIANKFFDNPYYMFNENTDFNSNLYYMSYYALGMHLLGITLDLVKRNKSKKTIHFVARDGYQCKVVYDILKKYISDLPESNYLYLSRKALLPLAFTSPEDIPYIKDNISFDSVTFKTPAMIMKQFLGLEDNKEIKIRLKKEGFDSEAYFKNFESFNTFLKILCKDKTLFTSLRNKKQLIQEKLNDIIDEQDLLFDIGYNGTAQKILSILMEKPIDAYYVYINKDKPMLNETELGYKVETFYDRTPCISGAIREFMFSKGEPSCIGYDIHNNNLIPKLEKEQMSYIEKEMSKIISLGVSDFAEDFLSKFADVLPLVTSRNYDISLPFEFLMERASDMDRNVFSCCYFEDDIFSGKGKIEMTSWWNNYSVAQESRLIVQTSNTETNSIDYLGIGKNFYTSSRWKRIIVMLLIAPNILRNKLKDRL